MSVLWRLGRVLQNLHRVELAGESMRRPEGAPAGAEQLARNAAEQTGRTSADRTRQGR